jgi:hypothetical protein
MYFAPSNFCINSWMDGVRWLSGREISFIFLASTQMPKLFPGRLTMTNISSRCGGVISFTSRTLYPRGSRPPVPTGQETKWAPEPVWHYGAENILPVPGIEPRFFGYPSRSPGNILTELSQSFLYHTSQLRNTPVTCGNEEWQHSKITIINLPFDIFTVTEAENSPPSGAKVKNGEAIPLLPHTASWRGVSLIKHRDNLTFYHIHRYIDGLGSGWHAFTLH